MRDHCHIVGRYRGAAHNECNLMYRISKSGWKLPVVMHNLKGYDGQLTVKALKSEFGKVRMIPHNMEKYLSLTVGQLIFIDSFQLTPKCLDVLAKTLADDEFRYLRESCISNHLGSSHVKESIPKTIWIALTDLTRLNCLRRMRSLANCLVALVRSVDCLWMWDNGRLPRHLLADVLLLADFF